MLPTINPAQAPWRFEPLHQMPALREHGLEVDPDVLEKRQDIFTVVHQLHRQAHRFVEILAALVPAFAARNHGLGDGPAQDRTQAILDLGEGRLLGDILVRVGWESEGFGAAAALLVADDLHTGDVLAVEFGNHGVTGLVVGGQNLRGQFLRRHPCLT